MKKQLSDPLAQPDHKCTAQARTDVPLSFCKLCGITMPASGVKFYRSSAFGSSGGIDQAANLNHMLRKQHLNRFYNEEATHRVIRQRILDFMRRKHSRFQKEPEVFYKGMALVDSVFSRHQVFHDRVEVVVLLCLHLAAKFDEPFSKYRPDRSFFRFAMRSNSFRDLCFMEKELIRILGFQLDVQTPFHFLNFFNSRGLISQKDISELVRIYIPQAPLVLTSSDQLSERLLKQHGIQKEYLERLAAEVSKVGVSIKISEGNCIPLEIDGEDLTEFLGFLEKEMKAKDFEKLFKNFGRSFLDQISNLDSEKNPKIRKFLNFDFFGGAKIVSPNSDFEDKKTSQNSKKSSKKFRTTPGTQEDVFKTLKRCYEDPIWSAFVETLFIKKNSSEGENPVLAENFPNLSWSERVTSGAFGLTHLGEELCYVPLPFGNCWQEKTRQNQNLEQKEKGLNETGIFESMRSLSPSGKEEKFSNKFEPLINPEAKDNILNFNVLQQRSFLSSKSLNEELPPKTSIFIPKDSKMDDLRFSKLGPKISDFSVSNGLSNLPTQPEMTHNSKQVFHSPGKKPLVTCTNPQEKFSPVEIELKSLQKLHNFEFTISTRLDTVVRLLNCLRMSPEDLPVGLIEVCCSNFESVFEVLLAGSVEVYSLNKFTSAAVAVSILYLSRKLMSFPDVWPAELTALTGLSEADIQGCVEHIINEPRLIELIYQIRRGFEANEQEQVFGSRRLVSFKDMLRMYHNKTQKVIADFSRFRKDLVNHCLLKACIGLGSQIENAEWDGISTNAVLCSRNFIEEEGKEIAMKDNAGVFGS